jgi:hypothetical protein
MTYDILKQVGGFDSNEKFSNDVPRGAKPGLIGHISAEHLKRRSKRAVHRPAPGGKPGQGQAEAAARDREKLSTKPVNKNAPEMGRFLLSKALHYADTLPAFPPIMVVDFDETMHDGVFPDKGDPMPGVEEGLDWYHRYGGTIILWTCRGGRYLNQAFKWMNAHCPMTT